jgi:hypothetical protein
MHKIAYTILSNKALFTFVKEVIAIINAAGIDLTILTNFLIKTNACFQDYDTALFRDFVDPYTTKISEADRQRDQRFLGFKNYVEACSYRKDESWQQASKQILDAIERYGNDLYRYSLPEESAALRNLITDLQQEPLKSACTTIEMTSWLAEMSESQSEFESLVQQRNNQVANTKTLMETRKPLVKAVKNLLKMIELQQQIETNDAFKSMVNQLNNLISSSMASARISRSLSDKANLEN